jgi:hypothetical protein
MTPNSGKTRTLGAMRSKLSYPTLLSLAIALLFAGTLSSIWADMLFRAFINNSGFHGVQALDGSTVAFNAMPFLLISLPLILSRNWGVVATVILCTILASLFTLPDFFIDDPQHGSDGQLGSWLIRMSIALLCWLAAPAMSVVADLISPRSEPQHETHNPSVRNDGA